jgi:AmmeMemoRadiSam system protein B/AmmeMemoRadiSam system protein A
MSEISQSDVPIPVLSDQQKAAVHRAGCELIAAAVGATKDAPSDPSMAGAADVPVMGVFVTLKRQGRLRGCCGCLGQRTTVFDAITQSAPTTALNDPRLPPVSASELPHLDLDVSLLHNFQTLPCGKKERVNRIEIGRHGLHIAQGYSRGLLLPVVALALGVDARGFLEQVCVKAGISASAWKSPDTEITTFEAEVIEGPFRADAVEQEPPRVHYSQDLLNVWSANCRERILAVIAGGTVGALHLPNGDVVMPGAGVEATIPGRQPLRYASFEIRPNRFVQDMIGELIDCAARDLGGDSRQITTDAQQRLSVELTVLDDIAMHGTLAAVDLRGIDPSRRGVIVRDRGNVSWRYDPLQTSEELVGEVAAKRPPSAELFSARVATTHAPAMHESEEANSIDVRSPAIAGTFYPGEPEELKTLVDELLAQDDVEAAAWSAALVPHAGLVYSGRIAAATLRRIAMPKTVIVIGPKHHPGGANWAVAPHDVWSIPGAIVPADRELAQQLARSIPRLELDALPHRYEHSVEIELPLIDRLAPGTRVVGMVVGPTEYDDCRRFADGLAKVLQANPQPILPLISSDLNHFAEDGENRRRDKLVLDAIKSLDARSLFENVRRHRMSMCGMAPAVIVMEALRRLGRLSRCHQVAYATSGDVSGDRSRVVGYAGLLFG